MTDTIRDGNGHAAADLSRELANLCWQALHLDQARRWHQGERLRAEEYFRHLPTLLGDERGMIDQIYNEILLRRQRGETPTVEEYLERFPERAQELRDQFDLDNCLAGRSLDAARPPAEEQGDRPPHLPGYEVLGQLGRGGMGVVWKARQRQLNRLVAIKMIRAGTLATAEDRARFQAEIEAVARVRHPSIVQIHHVDQVDGRPYFVMEYLSGGSLAERLERRPQPPQCAARLVEKLARGVEAAHRAGIVHRDLKPANILLASSAEVSLGDVEPKIADFGLAKHLDADSGLTRTGALIGSPSYMSPEQAAGLHSAIGPLSDVHALGAILYEMLTGRPPFVGASVTETLHHVREQEPVALRRLQSTLPRDLETICLKCLHKEPQRRYESAAALADDLRRFVEGKPIRARPVGRLETGWRWCRRNPALAGALAAALVFLIAGSVAATVLAFAAQREANAARTSEQTEKETRARAELESYFYQGILAADIAWRDGNVLHTQRLLDASPPALRGWEWDYLQRLCNGQEVLCRGASAAQRAVAISPDGQRIAATGDDAHIRLWDATTGELLHTIPHTLHHNCLTFRGDGTLLACSGGYEGEVRLTEPETGRELHSVIGHRVQAPRAAFSADHRLLATASVEGDIKIWDVARRTVRELQHGPRVGVSALAFRRDGQRLVSGSADTTLIVWDVPTGRERFVFRGHRLRPHVVAFSPDGKWIASATAVSDNRKRQEPAEVFIWNAETGSDLSRLEGVTNTVNGLVFSADGKTLAAAGNDRTIRLWDLPSGKGTILVRGHRAFNALAFTPSGRLVSASEDGTVRVWDTRRDPRCLILRGEEQKTPSSMVFTRDGRRLLLGQLSGELLLWDLTTRRPRVVERGHDGAVIHSVALHPNDVLAASGGRDGLVRLWDVRTMRQLGAGLPHGDHVQTVAFSPNGVWLATGCRDGKVRLWDVESRQCQHLLLGHTNLVQRAAFSPDGTKLATCGDDRSIRLWNVADGQRLVQRSDLAANVTCVAFRPDGRALATGLGSGEVEATLWDAATLTPLVSYLGHELKMTDMAFTPDGERLVSGGDDGTLRLWDVKTGREVLTWRDHGAGVTSVAFTRDGRWLASGGWDRTVRLWEAAAR